MAFGSVGMRSVLNMATVILAVCVVTSLAWLGDRSEAGSSETLVYQPHASGAFTYKCMKCICQVEGCERNVGKCSWDVSSMSCGPYQIKDPYWNDCYKPGSGWQSCTKQMSCSETCVKSYMSRYGRYCTGGRAPTCKDYAMIHNGGPRGCQKGLEAYWAKVRTCCGGEHGCD